MKKSVRLLSLFLCIVMILPTSLLTGVSAAGAANGAFIFLGKSTESYISNTGTLDAVTHSANYYYSSAENAMQLMVTGSDPWVCLQVSGDSAKISADQKKFMVITYCTPAANSAKATQMQVFGIVGNAARATSDAQTYFDLTTDGNYHSKIIDMSDKAWWTGVIKVLRLDFFCDASYGDTMYLDSLILCDDEQEAQRVSEERLAVAGKPVLNVDGDWSYEPNPDGVSCTVTKYAGTDTEIVIPAEMNGYKVQELGTDLFSGKTTITSVTVPEGVTVIGRNVFSGCTKLTQISLPETLDWIKYRAFYNCTGLMSVHLPDSITKMSADAFAFCKNIEAINYPENWEITYNTSDNTKSGSSTTWRSPFYECSKLKSVTIPEGTTDIAAYAFQNISTITSVQFPSTLERISKYAFYRNNLTEVILPDNVQMLSAASFGGNSSMTTLRLPSNLTEIDGSSSPFSGCSSLTTLIIPEGTKVLPDYLFSTSSSGFPKVTSITLPNSLTSIGRCGLSGFGGVTSLEIPASVEKIGQSALAGCSGLRELAVPEGVTEIGAEAFQNCSSLTSFKWPETVTAIGRYTFAGCTSLTDVEIPDTVTSIGEYAFQGCSGFTSFIWPASVTEIENNMFEDCSGLMSISIPDTVTKIGEIAFQRCTSLTSFTWPENVATIWDNTFCGCSSLTYIEIPDTVNEIYDSVFQDCTSLTSVTWPKNAKRIGISTFEGCTNLKSVEIPDTVNTIGAQAFRNCSSLTSFTWPKATYGIYEYTFDGCTSLTNIDISGTINEIRKFAFRNCSSLTSFAWPENVTTIDISTFEGCSGLTSINIPNTVSTIGSSAFKNCTGLTSFEWPESATKISASTFEGCGNLVSIEIPSTVTTIDGAAFRYCTGLTSFEWPESVKAISASTFLGCTGLTNIKIPDTVSSIGGAAFQNCSALMSLAWPENAKTINASTFYGCTNLTDFEIPNTVTSIGQSAFQDCASLKKIVVPEGITTINPYTFSGCTALESVLLPETVKGTLGNSAFYKCSSLKQIDIPDAVTDIGNSCFQQCTSLVIVKLPKSFKRTSAYTVYVGDPPICPFLGCDVLAEVEIPEGIVSIPAFMFWNNTELTELVIPASVTTFTKNSFNNCGTPLIKVYYGSRAHTVLTSEEYSNLVVLQVHDHVFGDEIRTDATCDIGGSVKSTCSVCGYVQTQILPSLGHDYQQVTVDPTCTEKGTVSTVCTRCGKTTSTTTSPALGHTMGEWIVVTVPTCGSQGMEKSICTRCGYEAIRMTPAQPDNHVYEIKETIAPTCGAEGYTVYRCSVCGDEKQDDLVPAKGHSWAVSNTVEPTCTVDGYTEYICGSCGLTERRDQTSATGHDMILGRTIAPTCTETGYDLYICSNNCTHTERRNVVAVLGHNYVEKATVAPTCTAAGYILHECTRCGHSYKTDTAEALGHSLVKGETVAPTCAKEGYTSYVCERCDYLEKKDIVPAVGHKWTEDKTVAPTCAAKGYTQDKCTVCGITQQRDYVDALGHKYGDWVIVVEGFCGKEGTKVRSCSVCGRKEFDSTPAPGHHSYGEAVTVAPTCTAQGYTLHTCTTPGCNYSYKDNYVSSLGHEWGEWQTMVAPTVVAVGWDGRQCARCHTWDRREVARVIPDPSDTNYGMVSLTVIDAATAEPIRANVYVNTASDGESTFGTDSSGQISIWLPSGQQKLTVYASGYDAKGVDIDVKHGTTDIGRIALTKDSVYEAELTTKRMTLEEIKEAGIDVNDEKNKNIDKYDLEIKFDAGVDTYTLTHYRNSNTDEIIDTGIPRESEQGVKWEPDKDGGFFRIPATSSHPEVIVKPVSENFYLIIQGEVQWLKELFDVKLLITNKSAAYTLDNLSATLTLPNGLSLAEMLDKEAPQTLTQTVERVDAGKNEALHWYVCGDKPGIYGLSASLTGQIVPIGPSAEAPQEINDTYTSADMIQVWGNDALQLTLDLHNAAYYNNDYKISIILKNVSDITLYNLSHFLNVEQGMQVLYNDGSMTTDMLITDIDNAPTLSEFKPGATLTIEMSVNMFFKSGLMEKKLNELADKSEKDMRALVESFKAVSTLADAIEAQINAIRNTLDSIDYAIETLNIDPNDENLEKLNTLRARLEEFVAWYEDRDKIFSSSNAFGSFGLFDLLDEITNLLSNMQKSRGVLPDELWNNVSGLSDRLAQVNIWVRKDDTAGHFDIYDSIRTAVSSIPISFAVSDIVQVCKPGESHIKWNYVLRQSELQYYGVSNIGGYIASLAHLAAGEMYNVMPWYLKLFPHLDDPILNKLAKKTVKATEKEIAEFKAKDATGKIEYKVWVEEKQGSQQMRKMAKTARAVQEDMFTLSCDNETVAVDADGVMTFTGDGTISVIPNGQENGTLYIQDSNGNLYAYDLDVVEEHTCTAGERVVLMNPTSEYDGLAVRRCTMCDEVLEVENISYGECVHSYGEWTEESAADCENSGVEMRTCVICGAAETRITEALGHCFDESYTLDTEPAKESDGQISRHCSRCDAITDVQSLPYLKFSAISLTLQSNLQINYKVAKSQFADTVYENPYIVFTLNGKETTVRDYTEDGDFYVFRFANIMPSEMGDTITAKLFAQAHGVPVLGATVDYSVAKYCYALLNAYGNNGNYAKLRTLVVDLLIYGEQAQKYTNHNVTSLVTARLTADQRSWGTSECVEFADISKLDCETVTSPSVNWEGAGVTLLDSVRLRIMFSSNCDVSELSVKITSAHGTSTVNAVDFVEEDGKYYFYFDELDAGQMSETLYLTFYKDGVAVSDTLRYSIESYAAQIISSDKDKSAQPLVRAMMNYGRSAYAYVH